MESEEGARALVDTQAILDERIASLRAFSEHLWDMKQLDIAFEHSDAEHRNEIIRGHLWIGEQSTDGSDFDAIVSLGCPNTTYHTHQNVAYHRIIASDSPYTDLSQHFDEACDFIHQYRDRRVLIHCQAGVSRSATICIAYLMKHFGLFLDGAYMAVKGARKIICPNIGFMKQLIEYERQLSKIK
jgi:hypothetical protein